MFQTLALNKNKQWVHTAAKNIFYKQGTGCELKKLGFVLKNQTLVIKQVQGHYAGKGRGKDTAIRINKYIAKNRHTKIGTLLRTDTQKQVHD